MSLFKKEEAKEVFNESTAAERIIFEQVEDSDERACELVDEMRNGNPLCLNFQKLTNTGINKLLAFFAGACYALDGQIVKINEFSYLFARKTEFFDGSLNEFIEQF